MEYPHVSRDEARGTVHTSVSLVVHVSRLRLSDGVRRADWEVTPVDLDRAGRIRSPEVRARFLTSRELLRRHLAAHLGCVPVDVPLGADSSGKPILLGGEMSFSLSRSEQWCAIALSEAGPVGVDLEVIRPVHEMEGIVREFFTRAAQSEYFDSRREDRVGVFFRRWVQLEATAKALGCGIDAAAEAMDEVHHAEFRGIAGIALSIAMVGDAVAVEWTIKR